MTMNYGSPSIRLNIHRLDHGHLSRITHGQNICRLAELNACSCVDKQCLMAIKCGRTFLITVYVDRTNTLLFNFIWHPITTMNYVAHLKWITNLLLRKNLFKLLYWFRLSCTTCKFASSIPCEREKKFKNKKTVTLPQNTRIARLFVLSFSAVLIWCKQNQLF